MSSVGDATTVVERSPSRHPHNARPAHGKPRIDEEPEFSKSAKPAREFSTANFATTLDYLEEERPFFVKIGKDGLIAALQKLDTQLRNVRSASFLLRSRAKAEPLEQAGRVHILSTKVCVVSMASTTTTGSQKSIETYRLGWPGGHSWSNRAH